MDSDLLCSLPSRLSVRIFFISEETRFSGARDGGDDASNCSHHFDDLVFNFVLFWFFADILSISLFRGFNVWRRG